MRYRTKVTLILLAVAGFSGGLSLWLMHRSARALTFELIQEKVFTLTVSIAPLIDGDAHDRIKTDADDGNEDYLKVRRVLRDARDANQSGDLPVKFVYTYRPTDEEGKIWEYVVDAEEDGSEDKSTIGEIVVLDDYKGIFPKLDTAAVDTVLITDNYGTWLSAWAPVKNSAGESVALVGADIEAAKVVAKLRPLFIRGLAALAVALLAAAGASIFLSGMVTAPLRTLRKQVALIGEGDLTTRLPIEARDEFGELGNSIHGMADGLQEREAFKEALVRFVSSETTDSVIAETAQGSTSDDARRVTVLIAGLREFDQIANALPSERVFDFLSDWYSTMIDVIRSNRGSLEKSDGKSITATFGAPLSDPDQERHALKAALSMQQELTEFRRRWVTAEKMDLSICAVIHTGHVTVTDQYELQVMEFASLERIIGAASRIQGAVESESHGVVVSETVADELKGSVPLTYLRSVEVGKTGEMLSLHSVEMPAAEG